MSEMTLKPNEKLDVRNILKDLDKYEPKRRGWTWRLSLIHISEPTRRS